MTTPSQRYATSSARFTAVLHAVPDASWAAPSPCEGWSVADVLADVVATETEFMAQRGVVAPDTDGLPPMSAWPFVRAGMQAALDDPAIAGATFDGYFGPTTVEGTVDRFYTLDLIVHRWDIATACSLVDQATFTPDEIEMVRSNLIGLEPVIRSPGLFGPEVAVAADADDQTRLLAYIGRAAG